MIGGLFLKREVFILCILTSTAAVIRISESKLDDLVASSEFQIENYDLILSDRIRHCCGVTCS